MRKWLNTGGMRCRLDGLVPLAILYAPFSLCAICLLQRWVSFDWDHWFATLHLILFLLLVSDWVQAMVVGINMPLVPNVSTIIIPAKNRGLAIGIAGMIIINLGPARLGQALSGGNSWIFYSWRMLFIILFAICRFDLDLQCVILCRKCTETWKHSGRFSFSCFTIVGPRKFTL